MTNQPLLEREHLSPFRIAFKSLANKRTIQPSDLLLYNLVRGVPRDRGFTPITNQRKLASGHPPKAGFESALRRLKYMQETEINARFAGSVTKQFVTSLITGE